MTDKLADDKLTDKLARLALEAEKKEKAKVAKPFLNRVRVIWSTSFCRATAT